MRTWRKSHKLTAEQRRKDIARSYASVYKRRGKLVRRPCALCGSADSQMHHEDYSKPLDVTWLCTEVPSQPSPPTTTEFCIVTDAPDEKPMKAHAFMHRRSKPDRLRYYPHLVLRLFGR